MSVQCNTYVVLGAKFDENKLEEEFIEKRKAENPNWSENGDGFYEFTELYRDSAFEGIQHHNGLCILDNEYGPLIVGRVLAKSENHQGLDEVFEYEKDEGLELEVAEAIRTHLGWEFENITLFVLSLYR